MSDDEQATEILSYWPNIVARTTAQLSAEKQLNQNPGAPCKQPNKLLKLALP